MPSDDTVFSINHVVALARHAAMSTSYKPALLKALVRTARVVRVPEIELEAIGAEFVRLFWTQTVVFHLRQAASLTKEAPIATTRFCARSRLESIARVGLEASLA